MRSGPGRCDRPTTHRVNTLRDQPHTHRGTSYRRVTYRQVTRQAIRLSCCVMVGYLVLCWVGVVVVLVGGASLVVGVYRKPPKIFFVFGVA